MPRIRVIDTETQGLEAEHLVCEFGRTDLVKEDDGGWSLDGPHATLCRVDAMPPPARAIHHISAAETQAFPPFDAEAMWAQCAADGVDVIAAHVWAFDSLRLGEAKLPAICTFKVARRLWPREAPAHGNGVLRYWLEDRGEIACDEAKAFPPHRAGPDTYVTANILRHMLSLTTASQMVAWTKEPVLMPTILFGKHRGEWADAPADYLSWILRSDMDADTRWNAQRELDRRRVPA